MVDKKGFLYGKTKKLEEVQVEFYEVIRRNIMDLNKRIGEFIEEGKRNLDRETMNILKDELFSNTVELNLNINTIIVNFQRITGLKIFMKGDKYREKPSLVQKLKLYFLLDKNTSNVYGKKMIYILEELKKEISRLDIEVEALLLEENHDDLAGETLKITESYFKLNSDMNTLIDDMNDAIDSVHASISGAQDRNINLSFLLISAFLSVILFFPEFNNMLNLKNQELTFEEKIDEIIYEKVMEEADLMDLIDIKLNLDEGEFREDEDIFSNEGSEDRRDEEKIIRDIVLNNINMENDRLEREKDRINLFINILLIILVPFLIWIVFIAI